MGRKGPVRLCTAIDLHGTLDFPGTYVRAQAFPARDMRATQVLALLTRLGASIWFLGVQCIVWVIIAHIRKGQEWQFVDFT
jgi:hypothetical protein